MNERSEQSRSRVNLPAIRLAVRDSLVDTIREVMFWTARQDELSEWYLHSPSTNHAGGPVKKIDGIATGTQRVALSAKVAAIAGPPVYFGGEEHLDTAAVPPGSLYAVCDALDGTRPNTHIGMGYASNCIVYFHHGGGRFTQILAGNATPDSVTTWILEEGGPGGRLYWASPDDLVEETRVDAVKEGSPTSVSTVASLPEDRKLAELLLDPSNGLTVDTLGGSPMLDRLLRYDLGAVVSFKAQRPWDALDVLAIDAESQPATVITAEGPVERDVVMDWLVASLHGGKEKSVPPHGTVTNPELVPVLLDYLRRTSASCLRES